MNPDLTEAEMRRALFGDPERSPSVAVPPEQESAPEVVFVKPAPPVAKKRGREGFHPHGYER
jgi:hypothetical protein